MPRRGSRRAGRVAPLALFVGSTVAISMLAQACSFDWDTYDPRLTSGASGVPTGGGGHGAIGGGGAGGENTGGGGSAVTGGGAGGGGAGPLDCGGTDLLADDFEDGQQGTVWDWIKTPPSTTIVEESGSAARIVLPAGDPASLYAAFQTKRYYDLRGRAVRVRVVQSAYESTTRTFLVLRRDDANYLEISKKEGNLSAVYMKTGVSNPVTASQVPYDAMLHEWWQIRQEGPNIIWETSMDGTEWTQLSTQAMSGLFEPDAVRVDIGAQTNGGEVSAQEVLFDQMNGGGAPTGVWCPASTLIDAFDDVLRAQAWARSYITPGCTLAEDGMALAGTPATQASTYCVYQSASSYDLTGDEIFVEVPQVPNAGGVETFLRVEVDGEGYVAVRSAGANLEIYRGGMGNQTLYATMYSAADHRWWQLSESSGMMHLGVSSDGIGWTNLHDFAIPFLSGSVSAVDISIGIGTFQDAASPGPARFDNFNVAP